MRRGVFFGLGIAVAIIAAAGLAGVVRRGAAPMPSAPPPTAAAAVQPAAPRPAPAAPSFDVVKVAPDRTAVIAGRAAPGAKVTVFDGAAALGAVTADGRGEWVLLPPVPLAPGDRELRLEAVNPGGAAVKSQQSVALAVAPAPAASGKAETALAVVLPQGAGAARLLQRPDGPTAGLSLDTVDDDGKGGLALSGHAAPGASLQLYLDNRPLATAKADAAGSWSAPARAAAGQDLRLDEIAPDGHVSRRIAMPLVRALALQQPPAPGRLYIVRPGNNLWQIARNSYGSGLRYTIIYSANQRRIRDPDLIYPGQVFRVPHS